MTKQYHEEEGVRQRPLANNVADEEEEAIHSSDAKSPGVRRIEAITNAWSKINKVEFIIALMFFTYARRLAANVIKPFMAMALNEFGDSHKKGMISTVRQTMTASVGPIFAKLSDYYGRSTLLYLCCIFWIVGATVAATSHGLSQYLPGYLLHTLGHASGNVLNYALGLDTSTLRNRVFLQFILIYPSIINVWAGGVIADKVETGAGWRWGMGMWAIIIPVCAVALCAVLFFGKLRAKRQGRLEGIPTAWELVVTPKHWVSLFWACDIPGLFFLAGSMALILLPLSLGKGSATQWATAKVIVPLVFGVLLLPVFVLWEAKWAKSPIFPLRLMKDKHIMCILLLQFFKNMAISARDAYLYDTLVISFNQGTEGATRITSLEGFASTVTVLVVAIVVRRYRVIKPFILVGTILVVVAQGMHINFRGGYSTSQLAGLIAGEIIEGIGNGLSAQPGIAALQAKVSHEKGALLSSCWGVADQAGAGVSSAISGAIWTNLLPSYLLSRLTAAGVENAAKLAKDAYKSPLTFSKNFPAGTPARDAVMFAYRDVQRLLCIVAVCLAAVCIVCAFFIDNVKMDDRKYADDKVADSDSEYSVDSVAERKRAGDTDSDSDSVEVQPKTAPPAKSNATPNTATTITPDAPSNVTDGPRI